jgi:hypothetical protein
MYKDIGLKPQREETTWEARCGWNIILKWILKEIVCDGMDWIHLANDTVQWRALVNTVMDIRVP